jgi:hypothetical protein
MKDFKDVRDRVLEDYLSQRTWSRQAEVSG